MKSEKAVAVNLSLRQQPLWRLLAADNSPFVIALLQACFNKQEASLRSSVLCDLLERELAALHADGHEKLSLSAKGYVAEWLAAGWLERHLPQGADEEVYALSAAAARAVGFIVGLTENRRAATESRLSGVIHQLERLAEETDADPESRAASLLAERDELDKKIAAVRQGDFQPLTEERAVERAREIIALAKGLLEDFQQVREKFGGLNRNLRVKILESEGNRGEVLDEIFAGVDVIARSEEGRTFAAFWQLLTDSVQNSALDGTMETVLSRIFAGHLETGERLFLRRLVRSLQTEGGEVHEVLKNLARSLKHFVESREFQEQRALNRHVREAQRLAEKLKDSLSVSARLERELWLTGCRLHSPSQWTLHDPSAHRAMAGMADGEPAQIDLSAVRELVAQSEIDFRALKADLREVLRERGQVTVSGVLEKFPARQGLGSVVGLVALASKHAERGEGTERVEWRGADRQRRAAMIPVFYFIQGKSDGLD